MKRAFQSRDNKGFHITFPNGLTLSTQYGPGNYCDNYDADFNPNISFASDVVEVAIFDKNGEWITKQYEAGDDVIGRVSLSEWLKILSWCKRWKPTLRSTAVTVKSS